MLAVYINIGLFAMESLSLLVLYKHIIQKGMLSEKKTSKNLTTKELLRNLARYVTMSANEIVIPSLFENMCNQLKVLSPVLSVELNQAHPKPEDVDFKTFVTMIKEKIPELYDACILQLKDDGSLALSYWEEPDLIEPGKLRP